MLRVVGESTRHIGGKNGLSNVAIRFSPFQSFVPRDGKHLGNVGATPFFLVGSLWVFLPNLLSCLILRAAGKILSTNHADGAQLSTPSGWPFLARLSPQNGVHPPLPFEFPASTIPPTTLSIPEATCVFL